MGVARKRLIPGSMAKMKRMQMTTRTRKAKEMRKEKAKEMRKEKAKEKEKAEVIPQRVMGANVTILSLWYTYIYYLFIFSNHGISIVFSGHFR